CVYIFIVSECIFLLSIFFFFSSRRRHTRCYRDWSSDVCSSDLVVHAAFRVAHRHDLESRLGKQESSRLADLAVTLDRDGGRLVRSEERRVGKECRSRGWAENEKKKRDREVAKKREQREARCRER